MTGTPNDDRTVMIADMRKTMSVLQISRELGISRTIIYYHLRKWERMQESFAPVVSSTENVDTPTVWE